MVASYFLRAQARHVVADSIFRSYAWLGFQFYESTVVVRPLHLLEDAIVTRRLDRWWLLPLCVFLASACIALGIMVTRPPERFAAPITECTGTAATDYECLRDRYQDLVRTAGVRAAFVELTDERNRVDAGLCHQLTHEIGRTAARRYGSVLEAYRHGDPYCGGGYYHGVLEVVVVAAGPAEMNRRADTYCVDLRTTARFSNDHLNCVHGLGHGFMAVLAGKVHMALGACDALTEDRERQACYSGVFMQNLMALHDYSQPTPNLDPARPLYPCTDVAVQYESQCYQRQTTYALMTHGDNFAAVFDLCEPLAPQARTACHQGLGRDAAQQALIMVKTEAARNGYTTDRCALAPDQGAQANCLVGAVKALLRFYLRDSEANAFCGTVDAALREGCWQAVATYIRQPES